MVDVNVGAKLNACKKSRRFEQFPMIIVSNVCKFQASVNVAIAGIPLIVRMQAALQ